MFTLAQQLGAHGWAYEAMRSKVGMGAASSLLGTAIFIGYLGLFTWVPAILWRTLAGRFSSAGPALLFAGLMTLGEWLRGFPFNGFTSMSLGYALIDTWWAGLAPVAGVYALSFCGYLLAASIGLLSPRRSSATVVAAALAVPAVAALLIRIDWVEPTGRQLGVILIQGNVPQPSKFDPRYRERQIADYLASLQQHPADLVVTPETAFPVFLDDLPAGTLDTLQAYSRSSGTQLLLGIATMDGSGAGHNSIVQIDGASPYLSRYDKVRLMPFGEYSPRGFGWFADQMHIALKDLQPGHADQAPFVVRDAVLGLLICSEDLTSERARHWVQAEPPATLLVNPSVVS